MASKSVIELGGRRYNADWLRSVPEAQAVIMLKNHCDISQIRNAWKQANGKTVRNYSEKVEKPKKSEPKKQAKKAPKKSANK